MATLVENLREVWRRAGLLQRTMLVSVLLACAGAVVLLVGWARQPKMALLYSRLDPEEAARIVEKIRDADVPYRLTDGGTTVYVPAEKVYSLRLTMAAQGLPTGEQAGYRILDEEKIGTSPFTQRVNYIRAVEGELARSIQIIEGCLEEMPDGEITSVPKVAALLAQLKKAEGEGIGRHEAPRGEVFHYIRLEADKEAPVVWKVKAPTYSNLMSWFPMFKDQEIADIPIVAASIDPCICCMDRVHIVRGEREEVVWKEELLRLSWEKTKRVASRVTRHAPWGRKG